MRALGSANLDWIGREYRALIRLAWPIAVSLLSFAAMSTVDTLFVGHLGAYALAGVGLSGVAAFMLLTFGMGLLRGVKVLTSQARGAGLDQSAAPIIGAGLLAAAGLGVLAIAAGQWVAAILPRFTGSAEAGEAASIYLQIRVLAAPMVLAFIALREGCYGLGDTTGPMRASIVANLANAVLDYALIYGAGWGVRGAALASVAATAIELGLICVVAPRIELADLRRGLGRVKRLFDVGMPTGLQFFVEVGSFMALSLMISSLAELEMAAHQIALQVVHFSFLPAVAIGEAASVLAGQAVGAGRDDLVKPVALRALRIGGAYTALCTAVFALGATALASAFTSDPDVIARAASLLYVAAIFQIGDAANIIARNILRGTGDVRFPAVVAVAMAWAIIPPVTYALGYAGQMGALGGWIALCLEIICGAVVFWSRLWRGGWLTSAARSREALAAGH